MGAEIDRLEVQVEAQATKANNQLDKLVGKLNSLSNSLSHINSSGLAGLSNVVAKFAQASSQLSNVKTADFTRLTKNIQSLSSLNTQQIYGAASAMSTLSTAINSIGGVSASSMQVAQVAKDISKLGGANVQKAIANLPLLATAMNNLMATLSRAPSVNRNIIDMTNALANLASQGNRVGTAGTSLTRSVYGVGSAMSTTAKKARSFSSVIGRIYQQYFWLFRGFNKLWDSVKGTADYIEAYNYFDVALGKIGSEWSHQWENYSEKIGISSAEEYANSFQTRLSQSLSKLSGIQIDISADGSGLLSVSGVKNLGLNIREVTQYASQLASVTNSVGQTGEVSLAAASAFTKLGADMSSLFNVDYSSVMKNLQSGLIGQSRALYKYGIDITNATLQTYAYELGLSKAVSEMTQAEKMQLRMLAILDQSKVSWGDLANTINSPSNMIRQFGNNMKEVSMVLGQLFIPALQNVLPIANGLAIAFKQLLVNVASFLGIELDLESFGQGYTDLEEDIGGVSDGFEEASKAAKKFKGMLQGFDELNVIKTDDSVGDGSVGSVIDLTKEILEATAEYEKAWAEAYEKMQSKAQEYAKKIAKFFEPLNAPFEKLLNGFKTGDWGEIGEGASELAVAFTNLLSDAIEKIDWYQVGTNIGSFLNGIKWIDILSSSGNFLETVVNSAIDLWKGSFDTAPFETAFVSVLALAKFTGLGDVLWGKVKSSFSATVLGKNIGFVPTVVISSITWVVGFDIGKSLGEALFPDDAEYYKEFSWFGNDGFFDTISKDWKSTWDGFCDMMKDDENKLPGIIMKILAPTTSLVEAFDLLEDGWNKLSKVDISEVFKKLGTSILGASRNWDDFVKNILDNPISGTIIGMINPFANLRNAISKLPESIEELKSSFSAMFEEFKNQYNNFAKLVNEKLEIKFDTDNVIGKAISVALGKDTIKLGSLPTFYMGGFPEDGFFFANHSELVGKFSNGKTAVANNGQIIEGIQSGVRDANAEQIALLREQNELLRGILAKETGITRDDVGKAARGYAYEYYIKTGEEPYSFKSNR